MPRGCNYAQPEVESSVSTEGGSQQSRILVLSTDAVLEEAKCERLEKIAIDGDPEKFFKVEAQFPFQEKEELLAFLRRNIDVFAWNAYEAPRVDPDFICHHLKVNPAVPPRSNHLDAHLKSILMLLRRR